MKSMKGELAAFGAGAIFAVGLAVSGMAKPAKVIGFLDFAGAWDASLAFVMIGAVVVHAVLFRLVTRRRAPLFDDGFHLPTRKDLDGRLLAGAVIFGIGWGLGGYCPGPALVSASGGATAALVFVAGMTIGIFIEKAIAVRVTSS